MCIVLVIIAMLFAMALPSIREAFTEQAMRRDSHQLALMVKTAMLQSGEQHRNYVIDLSAKSMALHPEAEIAAESDEDLGLTNSAPAIDASIVSDANASAGTSTAQANISVTADLDAPNKLMAPDPKKEGAWIDMPEGSSWTFQPGELCPATHVRIERGDAYIELTFNALTGNVESEASSIP